MVSRFLFFLLLSSVLGIAQAGPVRTLVSCERGYAGFSIQPIACVGAVQGNLSGTLSSAQKASMLAAFTPYGYKPTVEWIYSKSDADQHGVFEDLGDDFTLQFDADQLAKGLFVLGLKQAQYYSLYLFDGGQKGISELSFNVEGVVSKQTGGLSHAVYFGPQLFAPEPPPPSGGPSAGGNSTPANPVSAPGSLMLALGALGLMVRRRRSR